MEWIIDMWESVKFFFGFIVFYFEHFFEYFDDGIRLIMRYLLKLSMWLSYQAMLASQEFVNEFLESVDFVGKLQGFYDAIPSVPAQILAFFRIPEIINILVSALGTRFVFKMMPLGGVS